MVSRPAIAKWEADKGMPDNGESMDLFIMREEINLDDHTCTRKNKGRWNKKAVKKDIAVTKKYRILRIIGFSLKSVLVRALCGVCYRGFGKQCAGQKGQEDILLLL